LFKPSVLNYVLKFGKDSFLSNLLIRKIWGSSVPGILLNSVSHGTSELTLSDSLDAADDCASYSETHILYFAAVNVNSN
jgi:hypothetical protein